MLDLLNVHWGLFRPANACLHNASQNDSQGSFMFVFVTNHYYFMPTEQHKIKVTQMSFFSLHIIIMRLFLVRLSSRVCDDLFCILGLNILADLLRLCLIKLGLVEQMPEGLSKLDGTSANNRNFPSLHNSSSEIITEDLCSFVSFFFGRLIQLKCLITFKSFI